MQGTAALLALMSLRACALPDEGDANRPKYCPPCPPCVECPPCAQVGGGARSCVPAVNWLVEGGSYCHHPVLAALPLRRVDVPADEHVVELGGFLLPKPPDRPKCTMTVPSRGMWCWQQYAARKSGLSLLQETLPLIDADYPRYVAWAHSAMRARHRFAAVALGTRGAGRGGAWGARGVAFLRMLSPRAPLPYSLVYIEPDPQECAWLRKVQALNRVENYTLVCDYAHPDEVQALLARHDYVDVLDLDVHSLIADADWTDDSDLFDGRTEWWGAGGDKSFRFAVAQRFLVATAAARRVWRQRVVRLILRTHTPAIHVALEGILLAEGWRLLGSEPVANVSACFGAAERECIDAGHASSTPKPSPGPATREALWQRGCVHQHPVFGPLAHGHGELILDNPDMLVRDEDAAAFAFDNHHLQIDDLKVHAPPAA